MFTILSIDGGGIRGLIPARVLERLERHFPRLTSSFDLFAGTSTGALLAAGLATGMRPRTLRQLYQTCGPQVFADSIWDDLRDLGNLIGADYSLAPLQAILEQVLGDVRLADLPRKILIAAFDLMDERRYPPTWKPKFFHNFPPQEADPANPGGGVSRRSDFDTDGQQRLVDVVLRSVAAPIYFPTFQGYIDGGVVAGNPSMSALAQALHEGKTDIRLLSLGTGVNPKWLEVENADWGVLQWGLNLVDIILDGTSDVADYQCRQVLGEHYFRLQPYLPRRIDLDDFRAIDELLSLADSLSLDPLVEWIETNLV